jgi:hypothetical protein
MRVQQTRRPRRRSGHSLRSLTRRPLGGRGRSPKAGHLTTRGGNVVHDKSAQDRITGFWNTIAAGYEAHEGNVAAVGSDEYKAWVKALRDLLPPAPANVLDVGTGTGFVALMAAGLGIEWWVPTSPRKCSVRRDAKPASAG